MKDTDTIEAPYFSPCYSAGSWRPSVEFEGNIYRHVVASPNQDSALRTCEYLAERVKNFEDLDFLNWELL